MHSQTSNPVHLSQEELSQIYSNDSSSNQVDMKHYENVNNVICHSGKLNSISNSTKRSKFKQFALFLIFLEFLFQLNNIHECDINKLDLTEHQLYMYSSVNPDVCFVNPMNVAKSAKHNPKLFYGLIPGVVALQPQERISLRDEAKDMFYHAYNSYMNTYPADEIKPISCQGRYRRVDESSDIDDAIGNFSLTLVDSLDTLVMMGDIDEFDYALKKIIKDLSFDMDIVVSVFETNIRMIGGLLSAHVLAQSIKDKNEISIRHIDPSKRSKLDWYNSEMLTLAHDLATRLLPAFETKTGIPRPRVNLRYGIDSNGLRTQQETCTACAGSLILEFATLSRLTGDDIFETKAQQALDALWERRHKSTDLVGTVLNVENGEWIRRESGVGAGSDSYYEYLMKAYILLGDKTYLQRFNRHYASVMRYIARGPLLIDVHMHRPNRIAKGFMDALSAFWPGLQVLKGDLRSAMTTHATFNAVMQKHGYLPEAFTTDLKVHWGNHQMRPEFLESTYFLHRATQDDYYLEVGREILEKLRDLKVDCGFAGLRDVKTGDQDDRMPSFVLAETFKYLYLLFSYDNETYIDLDKFIFSTEGHLLPINISLLREPRLIMDNLPDEKFQNLNKIKLKESQIELLKQIDSVLKMDMEEFMLVRQDGLDMGDGSSEAHIKLSRAAAARYLIKMSDKYNQDKTVIYSGKYDTSCPSFEAQDMRFDGKHNPFLSGGEDFLKDNF